MFLDQLVQRDGLTRLMVIVSLEVINSAFCSVDLHAFLQRIIRGVYIVDGFLELIDALFFIKT